MSNKNRMKPGLMVVLLAIVASLVSVGMYLFREYTEDDYAGRPPVLASSEEETIQEVEEVEVSAEDDPRFKDTESILVIVNKKHPLAADYEPSDLVQVSVASNGVQMMRKEAADALAEMFNAASQEGITLVAGSCYRSYATQVDTYNYWASLYGQAEAERVSARAGYSEHQTGLAIDISDSSGATYLSQAFSNTAEGQWLYAHAHEYGFVLRYIEGKEDITGYMYEPWHFRYLGKEMAKEVHGQNGLTLEEYFGIDGGEYE
ncbi:MAG: M15 family metallopeptidase [Solobacterium sp.]|nr:M15 family metallopeptidase [Solobacterium sp.]